MLTTQSHTLRLSVVWTLLVLTSRQAIYVNILFDQKLFTKILASRNQMVCHNSSLTLARNYHELFMHPLLYHVTLFTFFTYKVVKELFSHEVLPCLKSCFFYLFISISIVPFFFFLMISICIVLVLIMSKIT